MSGAPAKVIVQGVFSWAFAGTGAFELGFTAGWAFEATGELADLYAEQASENPTIEIRNKKTDFMIAMMPRE